MDQRQFIKLPRLPHSRKDYSHHKTFAAGAPIGFPPKLLFLTRILNQGPKPSCTAYAAVAIREAMTGRQYDPEIQWQQELQMLGNGNAAGCDLDTQMATGVKTGFNRIGETTPSDKAGAWFNVTPTKSIWNPNGQDTFDAIRDAFNSHQVPLSIAMNWYSDWDHAPSGIVPHTFNNFLGGHDTKGAGLDRLDATGMETIDGTDYIVIQGSWGEGFGKKGIWYFDRFMANKCFTEGIKYWLDNVPPEVQTLGLLDALYLNLKNLLTALANRLNPPAPLPPIPPVPPPDVPPFEPIYPGKIPSWADAIKIQEGGQPNDRNIRNNNPGNLKYTSYTKSLGASSHDQDNFCIFTDFASGHRALCQFLKDACNNDLYAFHDKTLLQFTRIYAEPPNDNYANAIATALKVDVTIPIKQLL